ncbi:MAG: hypothetical protein VB934_12240 [Polyangiaceae bacterium]
MFSTLPYALVAQAVRPPEGLARGRWPAPAWVVVALALLLVTSVVTFFVLRHRLTERRRQDQRGGPTSSNR